MKYVILSILFVGMVLSGLNAQNPSMQIAMATECPGNEMLVSVDVTNFENIGAITLFIAYDSLAAQFISLENIHPNFAGIYYNSILYPQPKIGVVWSNTAGATLEEGKLFDIKFSYIGGICPLNFIGDCEIVNKEAEILDVDYTNGLIGPIITVSNQPEDVIVNYPNSAQFSVLVDGATSYQWQVSTDGGLDFIDLTNSISIQGATTQNLLLTVTNTNMDGFLYRCMIFNAECEIFSESALLTVLPEIYTSNLTFQEGWGSLSSYIDPEEPDLDILFEEILSSVEILVTGDQVFYPQGGINTIGDFDPYKGYAIKMSANRVLDIVGYKVDDTSIEVPQGWSYLPVLVPCDVMMQDLPKDFLKDVVIIKEIAGVELYWPEKVISSLSSLKTGNAYLIYMTKASTLVFPQCD